MIFGFFKLYAYSDISYDFFTGGGPSDSGWISAQASENVNRDLGSGSTELSSSPQTIISVDRAGIDWSNPGNVQSQNDTYSSANLVVSGGDGVPVIES